MFDFSVTGTRCYPSCPTQSTPRPALRPYVDLGTESLVRLLAARSEVVEALTVRRPIQRVCRALRHGNAFTFSTAATPLVGSSMQSSGRATLWVGGGGRWQFAKMQWRS